MINGAEGFIQNIRNCLREMNHDFNYYKIRLLFLENCVDLQVAMFSQINILFRKNNSRNCQKLI